MNRNKIIFIALTVIVVITGLTSFILLNVMSEKNVSSEEKTKIDKTTSITQTEENQTNVNTGEKVMPTSTLKAGEDMRTSSIKYTELPKDLFSENFTWQTPVEISKQGIVVDNYSQCGDDLGMGCNWYRESKTSYSQIAKFSYKQKEGIVFYMPGNNFSFAPTYFGNQLILVNYNDQITLLAKNSQPLTDEDGINKNKLFVDKYLYLPKNTSIPKEMNITGKQMLLLADAQMDVVYTGQSGSKIAYFDNKDIWNYGDFFLTFTNNIEGIQPIQYNIKLPKIFNLDINKKYNVDTYDNTRISGCGGRSVDIVSSPKEDDFEKIGKADDGNIIYKFKNNSDGSEVSELLKNYNGFQENANQPTTTLDKFLLNNPIIIMKDGFDRYIRFTKKEYLVNLAECGKPVIYLYPTKDTKVNVQVEPNGGLTKVDPFYPTNGWLVNAKPNGELTNTDGLNYPYLFWEGNAYDMKVPTDGFVLKKENIERDMTKLLARLGLNEKETADFLEFWQIKLEEKPYVFVTFVSQTDFDKVAPLNISPRPDKTIRVFMDYQPLDFPIRANPLKIETPTRTGFTVVEWGGRLHQ